MQKRCFKCKAVKELSLFYKHPNMLDGHLNKCKECTKKDVGVNRKARVGYYRNYDVIRSKTEKRIQLRNKTTAEYERKYPDRVKAVNAVNNALRDGRIKKFPCAFCGSKKSVGHHEDYSRPFDVIWLCQSHHKQLHAERDKKNK